MRRLFAWLFVLNAFILVVAAILILKLARAKMALLQLKEPGAEIVVQENGKITLFNQIGAPIWTSLLYK